MPTPLDGVETADFKALFAAESLTTEDGTRPYPLLPPLDETLTLSPALLQGPMPERQAMSVGGKVLPFPPLLDTLSPVLTGPLSLTPELEAEPLAAAGTAPAFGLGGWLIMPTDLVTPDADTPVTIPQAARPARTAWDSPGGLDMIGQGQPQPMLPGPTPAPAEIMNLMPAEGSPLAVMPDPAWLRALPGEGAMKLRKDSNSSDPSGGRDGSPIVSLVTETPKAHSPEQIQLPQPMSQAGFDESLGDQVRWLFKQRIPVAHIELEPAELGPLQVRIALDEDNARVHFVTQHRETRELLEAAFPKLRETLANDGIHLMDASVEQSPSGQGQGSSHLSGYWAGSDPAPEGDPASTTEAVQVSRIRSGSIGLVDLYI